MTWELFAVFLGSSLRLAAPLLLAGIGELVSERAGVLNMSIEGMMLTGGVCRRGRRLGHRQPAARSFDSHRRCVSGRAAASGSEQYVARQPDRHWYWHQHPSAGGDHARLSRDFRRAFTRANSRFTEMEPAAARRHSDLRLSRIPAGVAALCRAAIIAMTALVLRYTSVGIVVHAAGAEPRAVDKSGVSVPWVRYLGVIFAGFMSALAGAFLRSAISTRSPRA